jgi:hypothetical protein
MADEVNPGLPPQMESSPPPVQPAPPPQNMGWSQVPAPGQYAGQPAQDGALASIIPTSNPPSLVSYYCGVFSLTVCPGFILGPIAIISGVKALNRIKAQPGLKGRGHALTGIITGSIGSLLGFALLILIVGLFATHRAESR